MVWITDFTVPTSVTLSHIIQEEAAKKRVNEEEARKRPKEDWGRGEGQDVGGGEEEEALD